MFSSGWLLLNMNVPMLWACRNLYVYKLVGIGGWWFCVDVYILRLSVEYCFGYIRCDVALCCFELSVMYLCIYDHRWFYVLIISFAYYMKVSLVCIFIYYVPTFQHKFIRKGCVVTCITKSTMYNRVLGGNY